MSVNCSESTPTKETNNKKISSKKNSSKKTIASSSKQELKRTTEAKEKIDIELREKFADLPFEEIKANLVNDPTVDIRTARQYRAILTYRLKHYKPKTDYKPKPKGRVELLPDWWHQRDEKDNEPDHNIDFEAERKRVLKSLGHDV